MSETAAPAQAAPNRPETIDQNLRCALTDHDKIRIADHLARTLQELEQVNDELDGIKADFKGRIEGLEKSSKKSRQILVQGFEFKWVTCKVLYNDPKNGDKTLIRLDTGEVVRIEEMNYGECQENLPLENQPLTNEMTTNVVISEGSCPQSESLLPVPVAKDSNAPTEPQGTTLPSAGQGNDEQLPGGVSAGPAPDSDEQKQSEKGASLELVPPAEKSLQTDFDPEKLDADHLPSANGSDPLYQLAVSAVQDAGKASTSLLQHALRIRYARAAHLIDMMEHNGIVGPAIGTNPREVLKQRETRTEEQPGPEPKRKRGRPRGKAAAAGADGNA